MGVFLIVIFCLLGLVSIWMTASAINALTGQRAREDDMINLFEQVVGSIRSGDLPRAVLLLEGEPGPLATLLSAILTEATRFTPKLRVAYKITLESLKRRSLLNVSHLKAAAFISIVLGLLAIVTPIAALVKNTEPAWSHAILVLIVAFAIALFAQIFQSIAIRRDRDGLIAAGELGRKLLKILMGSEKSEDDQTDIAKLYED